MILGLPEQPVPRELLERMENRAHRAHRDLLGRLDRLDPQDQPSRAPQALRGLLGPLEGRERQVPLARWDRPALMVHQDLLDLPDLPALRVRLVPLELTVPRDLLALLDRRAHRDQLDRRVPLERGRPFTALRLESWPEFARTVSVAV